MEKITDEYIGFVDNVGLAYYHDKVLKIIDNKISSLIDGAPEDLNTLDELAAALKDNKDVLDAYYTKTEVDTELKKKSDSSHNHDASYYKKAEIDSKLASKSDSTHTHDAYLAVEGTAAAAEKLTIDNGSATQPIYFKNGVPVATTYSLAKSVPANAKFTDTKYDAATTTTAGLMSAEDKVKLNGIAANANNYTYTLPTASSSALGGIKTNYAQNGKNYAIKVDANGNAYVNVPWEAGSTTVTGDYVPLTRTINGKTLNQDISLTYSDVGAAPASHTHSDYLSRNPNNIEFGTVENSGHGGYLDFHFNGSAADYTSRIIESASGELSLNILGDVRVGNITYGNWKGSAIPVANGGTGATTAAAALTNLGAAPASHGTHVSDTNLTQWNAAYNHSTSTHAPSNAQKNSDITKAEIEAKLTGTITSHNHSGTYATTGDLNITNTNLSTLNGTVASINTIVNNLSSSQGKVTQKNTTASDYRALVLGTTYNSDPANLTTEVTGEAYISSTIYARASNGSLYATTFHGSGANLTNLNAGNIASGTLNIARMPAGLMKITSWNSSTGELQLSTT